MASFSAQSLPAALHVSAVQIARRVASAGQRAWIVGGPVRDLALGRKPSDLDMASALLPDQIEALFERTNAVGKAFGTVLVHVGGIDVQLTTFRRERGFSDARRPDLVEYTDKVAEDARRRDFTCNALYLDPLNDELCDPEGGMHDIEARVLRAVGDPRARFAEDGLRLVRLARFAAALDFAVDPRTLEAAAQSVAALIGVSAERRLSELERIFETPRSARGIEILATTGLLQTLLPGFHELCPDRAALERRLRALKLVENGERAVGSAPGLALLLEPGSAAGETATRSILDFLRPSRVLREAIEALWKREAEATALAGAPRSRLVRFARAARAGDGLRLARAWRMADGGDTAELDLLEQQLGRLSQSDLRPASWISSADLERSKIARGPQWKRLLEEAETERLEGRLATREAALDWLEQRARELREA